MLGRTRAAPSLPERQLDRAPSWGSLNTQNEPQLGSEQPLVFKPSPAYYGVLTYVLTLRFRPLLRSKSRYFGPGIWAPLTNGGLKKTRHHQTLQLFPGPAARSRSLLSLKVFRNKTVFTESNTTFTVP